MGVERQIESGFGEVGGGDGAGGLLAEMAGPTLPQPSRGVQARGVLAGENRPALRDEAAEDGVHKAFEMPGVLVALGHVDGHRNDRVRRGGHEEDLRRGDLEDPTGRAGAGGKGAIEEAREGVRDLAVAPERGRGQGAGEGPVAVLEGAVRRNAAARIEKGVQRLAIGQDAVENI
jgi:hypothetical protein